MKMKWDAVLSMTLVVCAAVTTALVVRHEFFSATSTALAQVPSQKPVFVKNWKSALNSGVRLGASAAPVQLIEFADFECPYCATFHDVLAQIRGRYPNQVALTFVHFPLPMHRFALPAARAAECADVQGHFEGMHDKLFEGQESFGLKPWDDYATAAGVPDVPAFDTCMKGTGSIPRIEQGRQFGKMIDIKGTPTLIVNGWMLGRSPSLEELDRMVKAVLSGKTPISGDSES